MTFSKVWVLDEWPPFGKELLIRIRLAVCSFCIISFEIFRSHVGSEGATVVLIEPVPGTCLHFSFS